MAYVPKKDEEQEDPSKQGQPQTVPGTESAGMTPQNATAPDGKSPNQSGMSSFTDVSSYLDANKDQGQQLANQVGQNLQQEGQGAQQAADQAVGSFESAVDAGTMRPNQDEVNAAAANPTEYAKDNDKAVKFTAAATGTYNGPSKLEELNDYLDAQNKTKKATQDFGLVDTDSGQRQLVGALEKNPTNGQAAFDQMIFGQNPDAVQKVKDTVSGFGDLNNYLSGKSTAAASFADQAANDRAATQKMIQDTFGGAKTGIRSDVSSAVAAKQAALANMIAGMTTGGGLADYNWTPEELQAAGITAQDLADIDKYAGTLKGDYGDVVDPSKYFSTSYIPGEVTDANTIMPEQMSRYSALSSLMGMPNDYINDAQKTATTPVPQKLGDLNTNALFGDIKSNLSAKDQATLDQFTNDLKTSIGQKLSTLNNSFGTYKEGKPNEYSSTLAGQAVAKMFTDNGLANPFTDDNANSPFWKGYTRSSAVSVSPEQWKAVNAAVTQKLTDQLINKTIADSGKNGILSRTKYDPTASYNAGKTAFGAGGGYGII
jgi:hypothetical protein